MKAAGLALLLTMTTLVAQTPPSRAGLDARLEEIRARQDIPAIAAAIFTTDGIVESGVAGVRERGTDVRATVRDLWHLGSDTKAMTATLAGTFVAEGRLSWDDRVGKFFPEFPIHPALREITLRQLLTHQAGLIGNLRWADIRASGGSLMEQRARAVKILLTTPPKGEPGKYSYSNAGYVVAGAVLEHIGKKPWETLMKERLFMPLGMTRAGFGGVGTPGRLDQPRGHFKGGRASAEYGPSADNPRVMGPAGTVHASMEDWAKFLADQLRGAAGQKALLPPDIYTAIQTPPPGTQYGLGWIVLRREWAGGATLTHAGSNTMNYAVCWLAPERGFGVLVCANQSGPQVSKGCDEAAMMLIRRANRRLGFLR